ERDAQTEFNARTDHLLQTTCEVARALVGAHQAAMAMLVAGDWANARKYFSLSENRYAGCLPCRSSVKTGSTTGCCRPRTRLTERTSTPRTSVAPSVSRTLPPSGSTRSARCERSV